MKTQKTLTQVPSALIVWLFLLSAALVAPARLDAADANAGANLPLGDREKAIDKDHMLKIHAALMAYKKDQGSLPNWLSDLFPKYLSDPDILMSPVEKRTGQSRLLGYEDPKMKSSYIYEFSAVSSGRKSDDGKSLTMKEWKTIQMESFGPTIPVLRCHLYEKILNVAYAGDFFETGLLWETDPVTIALVKKLGPGKGPTSSRPLAVQVVSTEDGQPMAGVQVEATSTMVNLGALAPSSATSGDNGQALISLPQGRIQNLSLVATKPGYAPARFSWASDNLPSVHKVMLSKAITIGGEVRDTSGKPVPSARVVINGIVRDEVGQSMESEYETVATDAQGKWKSSRIPAAQNALTIRVNHPEFMPGEFDVATGTAAAENAIKKDDLLALRAVFTLEPGIRIEGSVLDKDGNPQPETSVTLHYGENFATKKNGKTGNEGRFSLVMMETCQAHLVAQAKGFAPMEMLISVERGLKPITFKLEKGRLLKGKVVGDDNQAIPSATVRLANWKGLALLDWSAKSDAEGRFLWDSAPSDPINLSAQVEGYNPVAQEIPAGASDEIVIRLAKQFRVSGKVVDAETKRPIDKFKILQGYNWGGPQDQQVNWESQNALQGSGGAYSYTQSYRRGNKIKFMALADGYLPSESPWFPNDAGWQTNDFELKKGSGPKGIVLSPSGRPVSGAQVAITGIGYLSLGKAAFANMGSSSEFVAKTDAEGRFSLPAMLASPVLVAVQEEGYAEVKGDELLINANVTLQPWGKIEGLFLFGTKPATNEPIMLAPQESGPGSINYDWDNFRQTTDDQGRFTFSYVPPGARRLVRLIQTSPNSWLWSAYESIEVKPGETLKMTYGGKGRPVIAKVELSDPSRKTDWKNGYHSLSTQFRQSSPTTLIEKAAALLGAGSRRATAQQQSRYYGFRIEENGTFRIENIPAGTYQLNMDVREPEDSSQGRMGAPIGHLNREVVVPEIPGGVSDEPLDLGTLVIPVQAAQNR